MTAEQAVKFLQYLGAQGISSGQNWVTARCPLARWTHKKGKDNTASFGLHVNAGGHSNYNCFVCRSGSAEELLGAIELYSKDNPGFRDFKSARAILNDELAVLPLPEFSEFNTPEKVFSPWSQAWLDSFAPVGTSPAAAYLTKRKVSEEVWLKHELKYDNLRRMIVAPYWNAHGTLAGARGRSIFDDFKLRHHDYTWNGVNNASLVWYNEPVLNLPGWCVGVEGQFDCWRTEQRWPKTVANLTAKLTFDKFKKIGFSDGFVHIPDPDEAGENSAVAAEAMAKELGILYRRIDLPQAKEEMMGDSMVKMAKMDPDRCHPDFLYDRIIEAIGY